MTLGSPYFGKVPRPADTTPEMHARHVDMLMARSNEERFLTGIRMFDAARAMVIASAPQNLSPAEFKVWLYQRIYGEPLPRWAASRLFGTSG
jgi:hypothetical protein